MKQEAKMLSAILATLALVGCAVGAGEDDYSQQRGISSDISASMDHGPTARNPGISAGIGERQEPRGAVPWQSEAGRSD